MKFNSQAIRILSSMIAAGVLVIVGARHANSQSADGKDYSLPAAAPSDDDLRQINWISQGEARFNSTCIACHGSKGEAGKVKAFTERSGWKPTTIFNVIKHGRIRGANIMPPWGDSLSETEIWYLVAYIKSLSLDFPGPIPTTRD